jgi:DNA-binding NarL/FixJ family response regulator
VDEIEIISSGTCSVLIVEDHATIAQLLGEFIALQPGFRVSQIVYDREAALQACAMEKPDLAILDIGLPDRTTGLQFLGDLRKLYPELKILVFSALSTIQVVKQALQLGANGFLEKSAQLPELLIAVQRVSAGQTYLGSAPSAMVREAVLLSSGAGAIPEDDMLVLQMLSGGHVVKEIATRLQLSNSMIYKITERLRIRFGAKTNEDLISQAIEQGVLESDPSARWSSGLLRPPPGP